MKEIAIICRMTADKMSSLGQKKWRRPIFFSESLFRRWPSKTLWHLWKIKIYVDPFKKVHPTALLILSWMLRCLQSWVDSFIFWAGVYSFSGPRASAFFSSVGRMDYPRSASFSCMSGLLCMAGTFASFKAGKAPQQAPRETPRETLTEIVHITRIFQLTKGHSHSLHLAEKFVVNLAETSMVFKKLDPPVITISRAVRSKATRCLQPDTARMTAMAGTYRSGPPIFPGLHKAARCFPRSDRKTGKAITAAVTGAAAAAGYNATTRNGKPVWDGGGGRGERKRRQFRNESENGGQWIERLTSHVQQKSPRRKFEGREGDNLMDGLSINAKAVRVQAMGVNSSLLVFPILFHSVPPSERTFFPFSLFDSRTETEEEGFAPSFLFRSFRLSSFIECLLLQLARLRSALCFLSGVSKSGWVHSNMQCLPTFISDALLRGPSLLEYQGFSPMYLMGMIYVKAHIWSLLDKQQNQKKEPLRENGLFRRTLFSKPPNFLLFYMRKSHFLSGPLAPPPPCRSLFLETFSDGPRHFKGRRRSGPHGLQPFQSLKKKVSPCANATFPRDSEKLAQRARVLDCSTLTHTQHGCRKQGAIFLKKAHQKGEKKLGAFHIL